MKRQIMNTRVLGALALGINTMTMIGPSIYRNGRYGYRTAEGGQDGTDMPEKKAPLKKSLGVRTYRTQIKLTRYNSVTEGSTPGAVTTSAAFTFASYLLKELWARGYYVIEHNTSELMTEQVFYGEKSRYETRGTTNLVCAKVVVEHALDRKWDGIWDEMPDVNRTAEDFENAVRHRLEKIGGIYIGMEFDFNRENPAIYYVPADASLGKSEGDVGAKKAARAIRLAVSAAARRSASGAAIEDKIITGIRLVNISWLDVLQKTDDVSIIY